MPFSGRQRVTLWVFVHGRAVESGRDASVEIVEAGRRARASAGGPSSGGYWWAAIPGIAAGDYTVRVTYPSGLIQSQRVRVGPGQDQVRFDEDAPRQSPG